TRDRDSANRRLEQNRSTLDALTVQFDRELAAGPILTWGFELYQDEVRSARQQIDFGNGTRESTRSRFPDRSHLDSFAAYLSSDWRPSERFDISAGLRYSRFDIGLAATGDSSAARLKPDDVTGDLHLVWFVDANTHLVANIGRGFRAPNIFDLGTLGPRPGNRFNVANPSLGPESVWSYDFGVKHRDGSLELEAYAFYMDYSDKITSVLTGEVTQSGRSVVRAENLNDVTLYGLEAGLRWSAGPRLEFDATLNLTRGTERSMDGLRESADRIPPLNGRIGMSYSISDDLQLESWLLFAARQDRLSNRDIDDPRINPAGSAGWGTLNLGFRWTLDDGYRLGLALENLGDKAYREHASGIDAAGRNLAVFISRSF
ncbi:MAG: TonB-dependent receptor, partial [Xanthomonadales bacterium]|nr:TonB-dependent receptor [Xanthomonadales bacterium]